MKYSFLIISAVSVFNLNITMSQWIIQPLPPASGKSLSMDFSDRDHGIVCGGFIDFSSYGRASYTTNRGANWYSASVPDSAKFFYSVKFVTASTAYMGGTFQPSVKKIFVSDSLEGSDWRAYFLKSANYGKDWMGIYSEDLSSYNNLEAIDFINEKKGIAIANIFDSQAGNSDKIIITNDSGKNWDILFSLGISSQADLVSIQYVSDDLICVAGNYSEDNIYRALFFRTSDGGTNWDTVAMGDLTINNFCFSDRFTGYLLGTDNEKNLSVLFKSSDGGLHWEHLQTFTDNYYNGVTFSKESSCGLLYGFRRFYENPAISLTVDYGISWKNQFVPPTTDLLFTNAVIISPEEMNVTGGEVFSSGIVLHTTNGRWTFINSSAEYADDDYFYLFQNYPNPFNPVTNLEFGISNLGFVSLKVYDILGKEIKTIVNEIKPAGTYSIVFDGSNLASGIYYYSLEAGEFMDIKKMVLLK